MMMMNSNHLCIDLSAVFFVVTDSKHILISVLFFLFLLIFLRQLVIVVLGIFGGFLLGVKTSTGLTFYDWESLELVRRIEVQPK